MDFMAWRRENGYVLYKDELICQMASNGSTNDEIQQVWSAMEDEWLDYCEEMEIEAGDDN